MNERICRIHWCSLGILEHELRLYNVVGGEHCCMRREMLERAQIQDECKLQANLCNQKCSDILVADS